jgi:hypothetical protein
LSESSSAHEPISWKRKFLCIGKLRRHDEQVNFDSCHNLWAHYLPQEFEYNPSTTSHREPHTRAEVDIDTDSPVTNQQNTGEPVTSAIPAQWPVAPLNKSKKMDPEATAKERRRNHWNLRQKEAKSLKARRNTSWSNRIRRPTKERKKCRGARSVSSTQENTQKPWTSRITSTKKTLSSGPTPQSRPISIPPALYLHPFE